MADRWDKYEQEFKKREKQVERVWTRPIRFIESADLCILQANLIVAAKDPDIGYEHANCPIGRFLRRTTRVVKVRQQDVEAMLWSANLLNEKGQFYHPDGKSFKKFVEGLPLDGTFNYEFNYFHDPKKSNGDE